MQRKNMFLNILTAGSVFIAYKCDINGSVAKIEKS